MRRFLLIILLALSASLSLADGVKLVLPDSGPYQVWFDSAYPTAPKPDAQTVAASTADITPPAGAYVAVLDSRSGNMAVIGSGQLHGSVQVKPEDFKDIGEVRVAVTHNGDAVESGSVELKDGRGVHTAVLDPSRAGTISFYGVKPGQLKVTVHYVTGGKDAEPLVQLVKEDLSRTDPIPSIGVSITADVATMKERPGAPEPPAASAGDKAGGDKTGGDKTGASDTDTTKTGAKVPSSPLSIFGKVAGVFLGAAVFAGVLWALWYFLIKNPKAAAERLTALGVQIPKQHDDPMDTPAVAPIPSAAPQPVQKIMLEDSAPTPLAAGPALNPYAAPSGVVAGSFTDKPRLVRPDGEEIYVQDGTTVVGREAGHGLSLIDEPTLSRKHAEIVRNGSQVIVRDLGSTNGTFVNGQKVSGDTPLKPGDKVQFGSVQFSVQA